MRFWTLAARCASCATVAGEIGIFRLSVWIRRWIWLLGMGKVSAKDRTFSCRKDRCAAERAERAPGVGARPRARRCRDPRRRPRARGERRGALHGHDALL